MTAGRIFSRGCRADASDLQEIFQPGERPVPLPEADDARRRFGSNRGKRLQLRRGRRVDSDRSPRCGQPRRFAIRGGRPGRYLDRGPDHVKLLHRPGIVPVDEGQAGPEQERSRKEQQRRLLLPVEHRRYRLQKPGQTFPHAPAGHRSQRKVSMPETFTSCTFRSWSLRLSRV